MSKLADYMAASEQSRRTTLRGCKYRPIARVVQHQAAKEAIAESLSRPESGAQILRVKAESLRSEQHGSEFDNDVAEHNADYIDRFLEVGIESQIEAEEISPAGKMPSLQISGLDLSFRPDLTLRRINRRNVAKLGVAFFRYSKNKPLNSEVGCWQSAIAFGYLDTKLKQGLVDTDPEKQLCLTLDLWSGRSYAAPSNAVYRFNEVRAACESIVERWPQIAPPENLVF